MAAWDRSSGNPASKPLLPTLLAEHAGVGQSPLGLGRAQWGWVDQGAGGWVDQGVGSELALSKGQWVVIKNVSESSSSVGNNSRSFPPGFRSLAVASELLWKCTEDICRPPD